MKLPCSKISVGGAVGHSSVKADSLYSFFADTKFNNLIKALRVCLTCVSCFEPLNII